MGVKKLFVLFIALCLPGLFYVFLKRFGKNEFIVPPLYQEERPPLHGDCGLDYALPYLIPDSLYTSLNLRGDTVLWALSFQGGRPVNNFLASLKETWGKEKVGIRNMGEETGKPLSWIGQCVFMLRAPHNCVLVDKEGRIRGHYAIGDREEEDRLKAEMKIILMH